MRCNTTLDDPAVWSSLYIHGRPFTRYCIHTPLHYLGYPYILIVMYRTPPNKTSLCCTSPPPPPPPTHTHHTCTRSPLHYTCIYALPHRAPLHWTSLHITTLRCTRDPCTPHPLTHSHHNICTRASLYNMCALIFVYQKY